MVVKGSLQYRILNNPVEVHELDASAPGVVEPEVLHEVQPAGAVDFYVEFYR